MRYNGSDYYYVFNVFGDVTHLLDSDGYIVVSYRYDAWGNITHQSSTTGVADANPYRYRGYRYDKESNLYYLNSRYYNPVTGRFLNADGMLKSSDSILGSNMFAYSNNNPVMNVDPSGYGLCIAHPDSLDGGRCYGPAGSSTGYSAVLRKVDIYTEKVQVIIDKLEAGLINAAYDLLLQLLPNKLRRDSVGTSVVGIYGTFGGLWMGNAYVPFGATAGIQAVLDANGDLAFQYFYGGGLHVLPHAEIGVFRYYYPTVDSYTQLEGLSIQGAVNAFAGGGGAEYILSGHVGGGINVMLVGINFSFNANFVFEVQYTGTIIGTKDWGPMSSHISIYLNENVCYS